MMQPYQDENYLVEPYLICNIVWSMILQHYRLKNLQNTATSLMSLQLIVDTTSPHYGFKAFEGSTVSRRASNKGIHRT